MKSKKEYTIAQKHAALRRRIGASGFKDSTDFQKCAGLFEGQNITLRSLREKAWKPRS